RRQRCRLARGTSAFCESVSARQPPPPKPPAHSRRPRRVPLPATTSAPNIATCPRWPPSQVSGEQNGVSTLPRGALYNEQGHPRNAREESLMRRWPWSKAKPELRNLREPIQRHLGVDLVEAHSIGHEVKAIQRVNLQRVLDCWTAQANPAVQAFGF